MFRATAILLILMSGSAYADESYSAWQRNFTNDAEEHLAIQRHEREVSRLQMSRDLQDAQQDSYSNSLRDINQTLQMQNVISMTPR